MEHLELETEKTCAQEDASRKSLLLEARQSTVRSQLCSAQDFERAVKDVKSRSAMRFREKSTAQQKRAVSANEKQAEPVTSLGVFEQRLKERRKLSEAWYRDAIEKNKLKTFITNGPINALLIKKFGNRDSSKKL